jgi:DNA-directed RNA polymerase subunit RPC12/RpoP
MKKEYVVFCPRCGWLIAGYYDSDLQDPPVAKCKSCGFQFEIEPVPLKQFVFKPSSGS